MKFADISLDKEIEDIRKGRNNANQIETLRVSGSATIGGTEIVSSAGKVDGENIADDTIDDDSIDFADVTGADLTLTDCAAVTASGAVQGATLGLSATEYFDVINTTQLVFIANSGATTNVIDADITN